MYGFAEITKDLISYGTWDEGQVPDDLIVDKLLKDAQHLGLPIRYHILYKPDIEDGSKGFTAIKGWFEKKEQ